LVIKVIDDALDIWLFYDKTYAMESSNDRRSNYVTNSLLVSDSKTFVRTVDCSLVSLPSVRATFGKASFPAGGLAQNRSTATTQHYGLRVTENCGNVKATLQRASWN